MDIGRQADRHADRHRDRQRDRQTDSRGRNTNFKNSIPKRITGEAYFNLVKNEKGFEKA